jgi:ribosomal protein S18 acetylase RimI-like enzyme
MPIEIRSGRLADLEEVLAVWKRADAVPSVTDDIEGLRGLLDRDPEALLVAVEDDRIVGTMIAGFDGWRGLMYRLAVVPDRRREGIARSLVDAGEARLRALGARRAIAMIVREHDEAVALWEACGYDADPRMGRWIKTF